MSGLSNPYRLVFFSGRPNSEAEENDSKLMKESEKFDDLVQVEVACNNHDQFGFKIRIDGEAWTNC